MQKLLSSGTVDLSFKTALVDGKPRIFWNAPVDNSNPPRRGNNKQAKARPEKVTVNENTTFAPGKKPTLTKNTAAARVAAERVPSAGYRGDSDSEQAAAAPNPKSHKNDDEVVTLTKAQLNAILETVTKAVRTKGGHDDAEDDEAMVERRKPYTAKTDESTDSALGHDIDEDTPRAPSEEPAKVSAAERKAGARRKDARREENVFALLDRANDTQVKAKRVVLAGDTNQRISGDDADDLNAPAWKRSVRTVRERQLLDKKRQRQLEIEAQFEGVNVQQLARASRAAPKKVLDDEDRRPRQAANADSRKQKATKPSREREETGTRNRDASNKRDTRQREPEEESQERPPEGRTRRRKQEPEPEPEQEEEELDAEEERALRKRAAKRRGASKANEVQIALPGSATTTQSGSSSATVKADSQDEVSRTRLASLNENSTDKNADVSVSPASPRMSLLDKKREKWAAEQRELQRLGVASYNPFGRPGGGAPLMTPDAVGIDTEAFSPRNVPPPADTKPPRAPAAAPSRVQQTAQNASGTEGNFLSSLMNSDILTKAARERERQKWLAELTLQRNGEQERVVLLQQSAAMSTSLPSLATAAKEQPVGSPRTEEQQGFVRGAGFAALLDPASRMERDERRRRQLAYQAAVAAQIEERTRLRELDRQAKLLADLNDEMRIRQELEQQTRAQSDELARQRVKEQQREARINDAQQRLEQERLLGELQRQLDRARHAQPSREPPVSSRAIVAAENEVKRLKAKLVQAAEQRDGRAPLHKDRAVDASPRSEAGIQAHSAEVRGALARADRFDVDDQAYSHTTGGMKVLTYRSKRDAVVQAREMLDAGVDTADFGDRLNLALGGDGRRSPDIMYAGGRENRRIEHERSNKSKAKQHTPPPPPSKAAKPQQKAPLRDTTPARKPVSRKKDEPQLSHRHATCFDGRSGANRPESPYTESYRKHVEVYKPLPQQPAPQRPTADRRKPPAAPAVRNRIADAALGNVLNDLGWKGKQKPAAPGNSRSSSQPPANRNRPSREASRERDAYEKSKYETPTIADAPARKRTERSPQAAVNASRDARIQTAAVVPESMPPPPRSPPVPAVRRRIDTEQRTTVARDTLQRLDSDAIERIEQRRDNDFANDYRYELSEFGARTTGQKHAEAAPATATRHHDEPYKDLDAASPPPVEEAHFAPFVRTSEFLDPARAQSATTVSREPSGVSRARHTYEKQLDPAAHGDELPPRRDRQLPAYRPLLRGSLSEEAERPLATAAGAVPARNHQVAASADASRLLNEIKRGLVQRQRELEVTMPKTGDGDGGQN